MNFKNELERRCFEVATDVLGSSVRMEHNKRIQIENALYAEVASFKGPPAKEVDVLVAELGGVDGFDQGESCCESDDGCEVPLRLLAA